jgi:hypothetical protein
MSTMTETITQTQQFSSSSSAATDLRHDDDNHQLESKLRDLLSRIRNVDLDALSLDAVGSTGTVAAAAAATIPGLLARYADALRRGHRPAEADALDQVREKVVDKKAFGGLGLPEDSIVAATPAQVGETLFLAEAWLEGINSRERAADFLAGCRPKAAEGTRPMTLAEKIFAQHVVGEKPAKGLAAGDVVRVGIDWILASELSWQVSTMRVYIYLSVDSFTCSCVYMYTWIGLHFAPSTQTLTLTICRRHVGNGPHVQRAWIARDLA